MSDLIRLSACEAVAHLKSGAVTPLDLIDAMAARVEAVDGPVNALPTLCFERARAQAREWAQPRLKDTLLAGLPIAVKDLNEVAGVRTTFGSPIYADHVPERSDLMVERLEENGALPAAKSNTPEFGAGANTFNEVFGKTRNPYDTALTCGGSSGGSAVALATGMAWLATGSDLGGSLRTPAGFCGVVGLRPSPGVVARSSQLPFHSLAVEGPMGRTVEDAALMLDAMAGLHPEDPISRPLPAVSYRRAVQDPTPPRRIAFSADLGFLPVDRRVRAVVEAAVPRLAEIGAEVAEACPDLSDTPEIFQTLRAAAFVANHRDHLAEHRDRLKPDVIWNIEKGMALTADDIARAELARGRLYQRVADFFQDYDALVCPTALVPPFDVERRFVEEIEGHRFANYIDWLAVTFAITCTSCPAISVPCGFIEDGLPVGLQIVGKPREEAELLGIAALFEQASGLSTAPIDPR
ncbi:MAG: amidase family protein [Alphaproteobacteria bacterium]|nr:amidase family protein [Alphaproteobacteria bacterium]